MPLWDSHEEEGATAPRRAHSHMILALLALGLLLGAAGFAVYAWFTPHPVRLGPYALLGPRYRSTAYAVLNAAGTSVAAYFIQTRDPVVPQSGMVISSNWILLTTGRSHEWAKVLWNAGPFRLVKQDWPPFFPPSAPGKPRPRSPAAPP